MHPEIKKLLEIQKVDKELARIVRDLVSLPEEETRRRKQLDQLRSASEAAKRELNIAQVKSRESDTNIRAADEEIRKLEGRQNLVKNNAEYQAILFQIESVRKERGRIEEEGIAHLDKTETLGNTLRELEERLVQEEATFAKFQHEASIVRAKREHERVEVDKRRGALTGGITPDLLAKYMTIFSVRDGLAVCAVEGHVCTGCYTSITPNDMARLLGAHTIVQCGSCSRLLYLSD